MEIKNEDTKQINKTLKDQEIEEVEEIEEVDDEWANKQIIIIILW